MKRKAYNSLLEWKSSSSTAKALIIKGARRVGKSFLAEEFAKHEYKTYILIDFSSPLPGTVTAFEKYGNKAGLDELYNQLSVLYGIKLYPRESLFVFDEVQRYPKARELVKHLVADGRFDILETGSLISIKRNVKDILIPSEEEELFLYPMDFEEFLWALEDEVTVPFLRAAYEKRQPLEHMLKPVMEKFRLYMMIGGMPQAVQKYALTRSYDETERVKRGIIKLYREDIVKYADKNVAEATAIFNAIPVMLAHHDKKIKFSALGIRDRYDGYADAIFWIAESMIGNLCYGIDRPEIFEGFSIQADKVKCYMADTGLLLTLAAGNNYLTSDLYKSFMLGKLSVNKGMMTENMVAQMLAANHHSVTFLEKTEAISETKNKKYEIDFVLRQPNGITALEVKSGHSKTHTSLDFFKEKYKLTESVILTKGDLKVTEHYLYLPLPMAMFL